MKLRFTLFLLIGLSVSIYGTYNYFTGWKWAFKQSPSLVFYSLHPSTMIGSNVPLPIDKVPNLVMDKTVVSDSATKEELIEATQQALTPTGMITFAACFNPRHAVSTTDGKVTVLICFECGQAKIITPRANRMVPTNRSARKLFDSLVHKYGLKTDPEN